MAFIENSLSNLPPTSGSLFFVDSGARRAADGNAGRDPKIPLATLDAAVARCTANNGDIIVVMPGHAETAVTTSIALDVAGIWVLGLGWGASRPTFTMSGTGGEILMSADSVRVSNIRVVPGIASVLAAFTLTGSDLILEDCETVEAAAFEFVTLVDVGITTAGSNRTIIRRNVLRTLETGAGATSGILMSGSNKLHIHDNIIQGNFGEHAIDNTSGTTPDEILDFVICDNIVHNTSTTVTDLGFDVDSAATGVACRNMIASRAADAYETSMTQVNLVASLENYSWDVDSTLSAAIIPSATVT